MDLLSQHFVVISYLILTSIFASTVQKTIFLYSESHYSLRHTILARVSTLYSWSVSPSPCVWAGCGWKVRLLSCSGPGSGRPAWPGQSATQQSLDQARVFWCTLDFPPTPLHYTVSVLCNIAAFVTKSVSILYILHTRGSSTVHMSQVCCFYLNSFGERKDALNSIYNSSRQWMWLIMMF